MTRDEEIFGDAIALPMPERSAFAARVCDGNADLFARVEKLLGNYERAHAYFERPLVQVTAPAAGEQVGDVIGRYTLAERIGEGGCGVVWRAVQREPVSRDVAFKIIKLGMDTREVIGRFEAERQALALMNHPHIARVFDGGATGTGRPYFVMELVRGEPITRYCDTRQLGLRARIDLFIQVCDAVQHAHQKGIIHRDLKPSNILVSEDAVKEPRPRRAPPTPKVIDFGIAKAVQGRLTDRTLHTALYQFIGTPAYMSPEQASDGSSDVDTRTDIYSLGVLLYELLTGETPVDRTTLGNSSHDEIRQKIRTLEPVRPSVRVRTLGAGLPRASSSNPPENHGAKLRPPPVAPCATAAELRGDLDWIVLRCLEKDRARRYESVAALALDLQRYLQDEPVTARPPSAGYVLRKLVRRHRVAVTAAGAIAAVVVLGAIASTWQAVRATRAEQIASEAAREQTRMRQDAETRQRDEARRWSRSDTATATRFLEQDRAQEGIAFLVRAGQLDRENSLVATRLLTALASRSFVRPHAPTIQLPVPLKTMRYYGDFSPDGRIVGVCGSDHIFRLVNFDTGRIEKELDLGPDVTAAYFHGNTLYVASSREHLRYFDPATGVLRGDWRMTFQDTPGSLKTSPDGRWTALVDGNTIKIGPVVDGRPTTSIDDGGQPRGLNFSPDGTRLTSISANGGVVRLWSVPDGRKLLEISSRDSATRVFETVVSHDNRTLALLQVGGVRLHDAATGEARGPLLQQNGHNNRGGAEPVFTPDDALIIATSSDRTAKVWRVATGELAFPPLRHGGSVSRGKVVGNGRVLFTESSDGYRHLWDLNTGLPAVEPFRRAEPGRVTPAPDGKRVVEVTAAGAVRRLWAEANAAQPLVLPRIAGGLVTVWIPDQPAVLRRISRQRIIQFDVATGRELGAPVEFPQLISTCWISASGQVLLVRTVAGDVQAWRLGEKPLAAVKLVDFPRLTSSGRVTVNREGSLAVVVGETDEREFRIWNLHTGQLLGPVLRNDSLILQATFSPDGKRVVTAPNRPQAATGLGPAKVWDVPTGQIVHELGISNRRADFSPDGRIIATTEITRGTTLWDAATGKRLTSNLAPRGPKDGLSPAGFSNDSRLMMNHGAAAGSVAVWDTRTGARVGNQIEHTTRLASAPVFSPDGSRVLTCAADGLLRVWETRTGQLLGEPIRAGVTTGASFSPDGRFILTQGTGLPARIWAAPPAADGRVPDWLLRLATLKTGSVVSDDGNPIPVTTELPPWDELRAEIAALPANAPYAAWGQWLLAPWETRTIAPGFALTVAEATEHQLIAPPTAIPVENR
jgi:serine/threonine protein kinase/WD40 repeat protein